MSDNYTPEEGGYTVIAKDNTVLNTALNCYASAGADTAHTHDSDSRTYGWYYTDHYDMSRVAVLYGTHSTETHVSSDQKYGSASASATSYLYLYIKQKAGSYLALNVNGNINLRSSYRTRTDLDLTDCYLAYYATASASASCTSDSYHDPSYGGYGRAITSNTVCYVIEEDTYKWVDATI